MAARTMEELLREHLGGQTLSILHLQAENERLRGEIVKLDNQLRVFQDAEKAKQPVKLDGNDHATAPTFGPIVK